MKSLKVIINLLNNELKTIRSPDAKITLSASADDTGSTIPICFNCIQMEEKLRITLEEINSQKLIISILNKENKVTNQLLQDNLIRDVGLSNVEETINTDQPKGKHTSQYSPNEEVNLIPTSNYYAVLSTLPDQITQDSTLDFDRDPNAEENLAPD